MLAGLILKYHTNLVLNSGPGMMNRLKGIFDTITDRREYLAELMVQHIVLSLVAILIITVIGILTGIYIVHRNKSRQIVIGVVNFLYTIPSIAMFGLFIPLIGIGYSNALLVLVIYGLLPVIRNTYTGLSEVDPQLLDAAEAMGATPFQVFTRIRWSLAFPTILSGFRTMVIMTIALAGLASFIGAGGLGQAIYRGINTNNSSLILIGSVSIAGLALFTDFVIGLFEKSVKTKYHPANKKMTWYKYLVVMVFGSLILFAIIGRPAGHSNKTIVVASKPTSEQYILGEIISKYIESKTDLKVERKFGIGGGTSNIHPAIVSGSIDIYPEYTGTAWLFVLKKSQISNGDSLFSELKKAYFEKYDLTWSCRLGFNNTYTMAMPENIAMHENINSFSDLAAKSKQFIFGAEFDFFEREDGLPGLEKAYSFNFKKKVELDINLKFQAIENHKVDVINAFSTDSRIQPLHLRILKDDKMFFPAYQAGIVIRNQTLQKYPELGGLLVKLDGLIDDFTMQHMNYEVEISGKTPEQVARDFLITHHLLKE